MNMKFLWKILYNILIISYIIWFIDYNLLKILEERSSQIRTQQFEDYRRISEISEGRRHSSVNLKNFQKFWIDKYNLFPEYENPNKFWNRASIQKYYNNFSSYFDRIFLFFYPAKKPHIKYLPKHASLQDPANDFLYLRWLFYFNHIN